MSKLSLFFCLFFHCTLLQAQTVKFETGPEQNVKEIRDDLELKTTASLIGKAVLGPYYVSTHNVYDTLNKKAYLILGESGDKYYNLSTYDNYISYAGTKKLNAESMSAAEEKSSIAEVAALKGKNYLFYVVPNDNTDEKTVYVNELSKDMVVLGSPIKIVRATDVKKKETSFFVRSSPKNKYVGILEISQGKGIENSRTLTVLDENLAVIWTKALDGNLFESGFEATQWQVTDDGNVFEFGFKNPSKRKDPVLYSYFRKANKAVATLITHGENKIFDCSMKMPQESLLPVVIGLFEEDKQLGYVAFKPDPATSTIKKLKAGTMTHEFMGPSRKWQFYYDKFEVGNAVSLPNGDFVFSLDSYYKLTKSSGPPRYFSGPAVLISLDSKGEENWRKLLVKRQRMDGSMISLGHMLIPNGNHVMVIYNDNPQNLPKSSDDHDLKLYYVISTSVVMQKFDSKGKVTKEAVSTPPDAKDFVLITSDYNKISKNLFQIQFMRPKGWTMLSKTGTMTVMH